MFNTDQSSPTIHYSTFQGNQAAAGGGMFAHAETSAEVEASTFFNNAALLGNGGAIKSIAGATLWLSRCSFIDNNAFHAGGALHTVGAVHLDRCNFRRNSAQAGGGAVAHSEGGLAADSCLFHDNAAAAVGGIALSGTGNSFVNCTIFGNRSEVVGGGVLLGSFGALAVTQSVLWGNRIGEDGSEFAQIGWEEGAALDLFYSAVEGLSGSLGGVGNIAADPMFVDPLGPDGLPGTGDENLRLSAGSPCINAGDPGFTPDLNATDLDGHARALCGRVDMGAYEFGIGDVDCDQSVGLADYAQFPRCITGPPGNRSEAFGCEALDFNADNFIDLSDYAGFQNVMTHEP
jgi:predicted outer membrane repeat protein